MSKVICLDLRALQIGHENRGIGMVAKSILENLNDADNEYIFYIFDNNNPIEKLNIKVAVKNYSFISTPKLKTAIKSPYDIIDLYKLSHHTFDKLRHRKPDIFIQFDFALGIPRWKKTRTFCFAYDLIPLIMKNEYLPSPGFAFNQAIGKKAKVKAVMRSLYYEYKSRRDYKVFRRVDEIISISDATKKSFIDLLGIPEKKIHTIPLAPVGTSAKASLSVANKIKKPYIFYVGGTDSRKRVEEIVYAFNIARGRGEDIALVLAGNEFKSTNTLPNVAARNAILLSPYKSDIHLVGFISDGEKAGLYQNALAFVFCTSFEGFGLPVIEAQQAGCSVIAYNNSSIREVIDDVSLLVKTGDYVRVTLKIILLNKAGTKETGTAKKLRTKRYSWKNYILDFKKIIY